MTTATPPTTSSPLGEADGRPRSSNLSTWLFRASVVVGLVPLVVALVRAIDRGWRPIGIRDGWAADPYWTRRAAVPQDSWQPLPRKEKLSRAGEWQACWKSVQDFIQS